MNGGQEGNGEEGKRGAGHDYRQNKNTILYNTEHTHTHAQFFSEYRLLWISLSTLLILSLHVCIYTYKATHHTHTDTHTFSVYVRLSFVCVCDRERGGFPLSLSRCVVRCVGGWESLSVSFPGTPGIVVSNLSVTLHPNKRISRFEIAASQILMMLTQSGTIHGIFERGERRESDRKRLDTDTRIFRAQEYTGSLSRNITNTFTPPKHTRRMCMIVIDCVCVCDCLKSEQPPSASAYGWGELAKQPRTYLSNPPLVQAPHTEIPSRSTPQTHLQ
jgi:hypothetical protein